MTKKTAFKQTKNNPILKQNKKRTDPSPSELVITGNKSDKINNTKRKISESTNKHITMLLCFRWCSPHNYFCFEVGVSLNKALCSWCLQRHPKISRRKKGNHLFYRDLMRRTHQMLGLVSRLQVLLWLISPFDRNSIVRLPHSRQ